ncbi:MAG TPA: AAA family ATPase [Rhabdochlamydiaceae bacterium]|nr:AAA family ATPase [Rhabdochlamydiaceae bacterium]
MERKYLSFLQTWLKEPKRKPLVIRGARQVGKTWLVKHLARVEGKDLVEINFEKKPALATLFESNDPEQILLNLSSAFNHPIQIQNSLLFLDEVQAVPEILAKLRWFAEDLPQLPVIAAGSLLEFTLEKPPFSMPVGRIGYMHIEPLSFEEFLLAHQQQGLFNYIESFQWGMKIPDALHTQLMQLFKEYLIVGGMPEAVAAWMESRSLSKISEIHQNLIATYRDDFNKYGSNIDLLEDVLNSVPEELGKKLIYKRICPDSKSTDLKAAFQLLCKARVCHQITHSSANGIPLAAGLNRKFTKAIFLDVGLCNSMLKLRLDEITQVDEIILINNGGIAEQIVGQLLRTIDPPYMEPELYYWTREEAGSSAEIDYLIQHDRHIVPIEVKAGKEGSLKSLHLFMGLKKVPRALRLYSGHPHQTTVQVKDQMGNHVCYLLDSIPFYLIGQIHRLVQACV